MLFSGIENEGISLSGDNSVLIRKKKGCIFLAAGQTTSGRDLRDCMDIINIGVTTSGIYAISPDGLSPFNVYCDMTTDGGGWVVGIQGLQFLSHELTG